MRAYLENSHKTSGGSDVGVTFGMYYPTCVHGFELFLLIFPECLLLDFAGISSIVLSIDCSAKKYFKRN